MVKKLTGRIEKYNKPIFYDNKVLLGNWYEERCNYVKNKYNHTSSYIENYDEKPYSKVNGAVIWNIKLRDEDNNIFSHKQYDGKYYDNYSTIYDLAYNYFPKWHRSNIERKLRFKLQQHTPLEEYCENYGNVTNLGLTKCYRKKWHCDLDEARPTSHEEDFVPPKCQDYVYKRFAIASSNVSKPVHNEWRLRGRPIYHLPQTSDITQSPHIQRKINPITWT